MIFRLGCRSFTLSDEARIVPFVSGRSFCCLLPLRESPSGPVLRMKSAKSFTEPCCWKGARATGPFLTDPEELTDGVACAFDVGGDAKSRSFDSRLVGLDLRPFSPFSDLAEREVERFLSGGGPNAVVPGGVLLL